VTTTPERREQIGAFFAAHATRLHSTVRAAARAPESVIEDACQAAWTILLRRPDVTLDARGLAWLATVAIREAWRQASTAGETPAGGFQGGTTGHADELPEAAHPDIAAPSSARSSGSSTASASRPSRRSSRASARRSTCTASATATTRSPSYLESSGVFAACHAVPCVDDMSLRRAAPRRPSIGPLARVWKPWRACQPRRRCARTLALSSPAEYWTTYAG
jgi:hypothetical protein